jgi:hypothetical protein
MRRAVRHYLFALSAGPVAASAAGAQTPAPAPSAPGAAPATQDTARAGATGDSAARGAADTARHGGMGPGAAAGTAGTAGAPAGAPAGAAPASPLVAQLDSVDAGAKSGLTSLPVATAVSLIQSIETRLQASGRPALRSIARDLGALRSELGASAVDGRKVGVILRRLGPKVTTVARTQSGAVRATLQSIGTQLTTSGQQLVAAATG